MIELFSGIGAQIKGINNTGLFNTTVIATADIEKDAIVSYSAIHNGLTVEQIKSYKNYPTEEDMRNELLSKNIGYDFKKNTNPIARMKGEKLKKYWLAMKLSNNLGDISKIKELPLADFWTYSFPCQDISVAGKQAGIIKGETRSGLLYEVERLLEKAKKNDTLPRYLLLENVKNLVGKQFIDKFNAWIQRLDELGYNTYWKVVNAKECGIAQNRERTFAISIRKDIDNFKFEFMKPFDSGLRLRDFLEDNVDEKYYISNNRVEKIINSNFMQEKLRIQNGDDVCSCLLARDYKDPKCVPIRIGNIYNEQFGTGYSGNVWSVNGISPTSTTMQGGGRQPMIIRNTDKNSHIINNKPKERFFKQALETFENSNANYGDTIDAFNKRINKSGYSPTLTTRPEGFKTAILPVTNDLKIRKLTPKECFRLMGFTDEDYDKALSVGLSNSAGYKQAGNSIVTNCIELIMEHLYKAQYDNTYICTDEKITNKTFNTDTNSIIVKGNYVLSNYDASSIVNEEGITSTIKEKRKMVTGVVRNFTNLQAD